MLEPVSALSIQPGLSTLYSLARPGSAVSREAQVVQQRASDAISSVERSRALFGGKANAISELWALANECSQQGWDGEDGRPIDPEAIHRAIELIRSLPDYIPLPEFAPEPDGAVSLDWIRTRNRVLSVSVGASDRLAFAWLDGTDCGHGVVRFVEGLVPTRLVDAIAAMMDVRDAAVRAA
jgi:hypothetical protein